MDTKPVEAGVAALVRAGRAYADLTQDQLAEALGMRRGRLSMIENGTLTNIRVAEAEAFKRVLGIPLDAWAPHGENGGS